MPATYSPLGIAADGVNKDAFTAAAAAENLEGQASAARSAP